MTSKQRAYLKSLAMTMDPIFQIGKGSLTPENTSAIAEALTVRELIKINVLQNCMDDPKELARTLADLVMICWQRRFVNRYSYNILSRLTTSQKS